MSADRVSIDLDLGVAVLTVTMPTREDALWLLEQLGLDPTGDDDLVEDVGEDLEVDEDLAEAIIGAVESGRRTPEAIARACCISDHRARHTLRALRNQGRLTYLDPHRASPTGPGGKREGGWFIPKEQTHGTP